MTRGLAFRKGRALLLSVVCLLAALFIHPLYEDVDNYSVSMVTMGLFGGNGCQYTHTILNALLGGLSCLLPSADVFALLAHALVFLCFFLLMDISGDAEDTALSLSKGSLFVPCAMFCLFFSASLCLLTANYGIQAVFFAGTGWLALSCGIRKRSGTLYSCGLLLLVSGMLWRLSVAAVLIPYILLDLALWFSNCSTGERRRAVFGVLPVCLSALFLVGCQVLYERKPDVREGFAYDRARILLEDYPTKDWEEIRQEGEDLGFTELDYDMARLWFLADTERMDTAFLTKMGETGQTVQYKPDLKGLAGAADELLHFFEDERKENYAWLAGMVLLILLTDFSGAPARYTVMAGLSAAGSLVVILFFLMIGRAPLRLLHMVFIAETLCLAGILLRAEEQGNGRRKAAAVRIVRMALSAVLSLLMLFSVCYTVKKDGFRKPQTALFARTGQEEEPAEEDFTLWEDWHAGIAHTLMDEGKLPTAGLLPYNLPAGDWVYGQPYFKEYLQSIGLANPARHILENENAFFATNDEEFLLETLLYLSEKTGETIEAVPAGKKNGIARYILQRRALAKKEDMR